MVDLQKYKREINSVDFKSDNISWPDDIKAITLAESTIESMKRKYDSWIISETYFNDFIKKVIEIMKKNDADINNINALFENEKEKIIRVSAQAIKDGKQETVLTWSLKKLFYLPFSIEEEQTDNDDRQNFTKWVIDELMSLPEFVELLANEQARKQIIEALQNINFDDFINSLEISVDTPYEAWRASVFVLLAVTWLWGVVKTVSKGIRKKVKPPVKPDIKTEVDSLKDMSKWQKSPWLANFWTAEVRWILIKTWNLSPDDLLKLDTRRKLLNDEASKLKFWSKRLETINKEVSLIDSKIRNSQLWLNWASNSAKTFTDWIPKNTPKITGKPDNPPKIKEGRVIEVNEDELIRLGTQENTPKIQVKRTDVTLPVKPDIKTEVDSLKDMSKWQKSPWLANFWTAEVRWILIKTWNLSPEDLLKLDTRRKLLNDEASKLKFWSKRLETINREVSLIESKIRNSQLWLNWASNSAKTFTDWNPENTPKIQANRPGGGGSPPNKPPGGGASRGGGPNKPTKNTKTKENQPVNPPDNPPKIPGKPEKQDLLSLLNFFRWWDKIVAIKKAAEEAIKKINNDLTDVKKLLKDRKREKNDQKIKDIKDKINELNIALREAKEAKKRPENFLDRPLKYWLITATLITREIERLVRSNANQELLAVPVAPVTPPAVPVAPVTPPAVPVAPVTPPAVPVAPAVPNQQNLNEKLLPWTIPVFDKHNLMSNWHLNIDTIKAKEILKNFSSNPDFLKKWKVEKDIIVLILAVQLLLNEKYNSWLQLDWLSWTKTQEAVKKFQRDNNLTADWVPWNKTVEILLKNI